VLVTAVGWNPEAVAVPDTGVEAGRLGLEQEKNINVRAPDTRSLPQNRILSGNFMEAPFDSNIVIFCSPVCHFGYS
jgi:hypothetical protein